VDRFFPAFLVVILILGAFSAAKFFDVMESCDGAVVTTVNILEPYACIPTAP
jgi:hypothetical protein